MKDKDILVLGNEKFSALKEMPDSIKFFYKGKFENTKTTPIVFADDFTKSIISSVNNNYISNKLINKTDKYNRIRNTFLQDNHMNFISITTKDSEIVVKGYTYDHWIELVKSYNIIYLYKNYLMLKRIDNADLHLYSKLYHEVISLKEYINSDETSEFMKNYILDNDFPENIVDHRTFIVSKLNDFLDKYRTNLYSFVEENKDIFSLEVKLALTRISKICNTASRVNAVLNNTIDILNPERVYDGISDILNSTWCNILQISNSRNRFDFNTINWENPKTSIDYKLLNNIFYVTVDYIRTSSRTAHLTEYLTQFKDLLNNGKHFNDCKKIWIFENFESYFPDFHAVAPKISPYKDFTDKLTEFYSLNNKEVENIRFNALLNTCVFTNIFYEGSIPPKLHKHKIIPITKLFSSTFNQFDTFSERLNEISTCVKDFVNNRHITKRIALNTDDIIEVERLSKSLSDLTTQHEIFLNTLNLKLAKLKEDDELCITELSGDMLRYFYCYTNYANPQGGPLWGSCMRRISTNHKMDGYAKNPDTCKMLTLFDKNELILNNRYKLRARAIMWITEDGQRLVDRLFYINDDDAQKLAQYSIRNKYLSLHTCTEKFFGDNVVNDNIKIKVRFNNQLVDLAYHDSLYNITNSAYISGGNEIHEGNDIYNAKLNRVYFHRTTGYDGERYLCVNTSSGLNFINSNEIITIDFEKYIDDNSKYSINLNHELIRFRSTPALWTLEPVNIYGSTKVLPIGITDNDLKNERVINMINISGDNLVDLIIKSGLCTEFPDKTKSILQSKHKYDKIINSTITSCKLHKNNEILENSLRLLFDDIRITISPDKLKTNVYVDPNNITKEIIYEFLKYLFGKYDGSFSILDAILFPQTESTKKEDEKSVAVAEEPSVLSGNGLLKQVPGYWDKTAYDNINSSLINAWLSDTSLINGSSGITFTATNYADINSYQQMGTL